MEETEPQQGGGGSIAGVDVSMGNERIREHGGQVVP